MVTTAEGSPYARAAAAAAAATVVLGVSIPIVYVGFPISRSGENLLTLLDRVSSSYVVANVVVFVLWIVVAYLPSAVFLLGRRVVVGATRFLIPVLLGVGVAAIFTFVVSQVVTFTVLSLSADSNDVPSMTWVPAIQTIEVIGLLAVVAVIPILVLRGRAHSPAVLERAARHPSSQ